MKVIRELIDYFRNSAVLTEADLRFLENAGWAASSEDNIHTNSDGSVFTEKQLSRSEDELRNDDRMGEDPPEPEVPVRARKTREPTKSQPSGATAEVLDKWLACRIEEWRLRWQALYRLSPEGARGLRELEAPQAGERIHEAISKRQLTWAQLWSALLADDYRAWFAEPFARGHATKAFRELLVAPPELALTLYRWFLRFPRIAEVIETAGAQRALLRGINHLLVSDPAWIAVCVQKKKSLPALLVLTLAEGARCFEHGRIGPAEWHISSRRLPSRQDRERAMNAVMLMAPMVAVPFLDHCSAEWGSSGFAGAEDYETLNLRCPPSWRVGSAPFDYFRSRFPSFRVLLDKSVGEAEERLIFARAEGLRVVVRNLGISEMMLICREDSRRTSPADREWLVQVRRFRDHFSRRNFCRETMKALLLENVALSASVGVYPRFILQAREVRKDITI